MTVSIDQARTRRQQQPPGPRVPPHDLNAEQAFLGAILLSRSALEATLGHVAPDQFYKPAHSHIYQAALDLNSAGEPVDPVTVAGALDRAGLTSPDGGWIAAITNLTAETPSTTNAASYARIIADRSTLRRLISVAGEITEASYNNPDDVTGTIDWAEQLLYQVAGHNGRGAGVEAVNDVLDRALHTIEDIHENGGRLGVPTGFVDLDQLLLGLHPDQLITIAARPGMGKTALGTQIATNAALAGHHALFGTIEMSVDEIALRMLSSESMVGLQSIRAGRLAEKDWPRLSQAVGRIADSNLWFYDAATATANILRAEVRRLRSRVPLELVIVDYLQLMQVDDRRDNRQVDVSQISAALKRMAREFHIPFVALAQLSRSCEMRADKRPVLSDLRESGAIENDSDVVAFIYRDDYYNKDSADRGVAEIIVAKQRSGPTGTVRLAWLDQYTRFANMARM